MCVCVCVCVCVWHVPVCVCVCVQVRSGRGGGGGRRVTAWYMSVLSQKGACLFHRVFVSQLGMWYWVR